MSQSGGGRPGGRPPQLVRLALRLPYTDLALTDKSGGPVELDDSAMSLALVLPFGIGPNEPRLLQTDDAGNLKVTGNGSAVILAAQSAVGAQIVLPESEWTASHAPAVGNAMQATQVAGAAGVRHMGRRVSFGFSSQAALAGVATVTFQLRDGAPGAGTVIKQWAFDLPAAIIAPFAMDLEVADLGTAATAMSLSTVAGIAGLRTFGQVSGVDAT